jgi:hypothetical protein
MNNLDPNDLPQELETAVFGQEVSNFWDSRMGQYLLGHALREYNSAIEKLKTCDATNPTVITRLQAEAWRAESFREWLSIAIQDGLRAKDTLEGLDE